MYFIFFGYIKLIFERILKEKKTMIRMRIMIDV